MREITVTVLVVSQPIMTCVQKILSFLINQPILPSHYQGQIWAEAEKGAHVQLTGYCRNVAVEIKVWVVPEAAHPWDYRHKDTMRKLNHSVFKQLLELPREGDLMGVNTIKDLHTHLKITDCDTGSMSMLSSHLHSDVTSWISMQNWIRGRDCTVISQEIGFPISLLAKAEQKPHSHSGSPATTHPIPVQAPA